MNDPVNHPAHYTTGKIEVIAFIEDKELGFHLGNAVKYIVRAGRKDPEKTSQDLEKAIWYIQRYIKSLWGESFLKCGNCRFGHDGICCRGGGNYEQPTQGTCCNFAPIQRNGSLYENN